MAQELHSPKVEILETNMNFVSPARMYGSTWKPEQWEDYVLSEIGADGMELHLLRGRARPEELIAINGLVKTFHQSFRADDEKSLATLVVPSLTQSLNRLEALQKVDGQKRPIVVYPELTDSDVIRDLQERNVFASMSGQVYFKASREEVATAGLKACWPTFHSRRVSSGYPPPPDWEQQLPEMVKAGEVSEVHVELGRVEDLEGTSQQLIQYSLEELEAFMAGPEQASETTSGEMLTTILRRAKFAENQTLPVVLEVSQAGLVAVLGKNTVSLRRGLVLGAHEKMIDSIRGIVTDVLGD